MQFLSAKDLCTRSAMQMKMFLEKPELKPKPNFNQYQGIDYQHNLTQRIPNVIGEEMGNYIEYNNFRLYFSNDVLTNNSIIEIKNIDPLREIHDWYLQNSFVQCAIYSTLSKMVNYSFQTSKFFVDLGNEFKMHKYDTNNIDYYLFFGQDKYKIIVFNFFKIKEFIFNKISALEDWNKAKYFDSLFKRKEYDYLKQYFKIQKI